MGMVKVELTCGRGERIDKVGINVPSWKVAAVAEVESAATSTAEMMVRTEQFITEVG